MSSELESPSEPPKWWYEMLDNMPHDLEKTVGYLFGVMDK